MTPGGSGAWFAIVAAHMRSRYVPLHPDEVEAEVVDALNSLEQRGYMTRLGVTRDPARFPLYGVAQRAMERFAEWCW
jgi:hypothetical protein